MDNKLKQRFVKDYNLPINIYDDRLFNYYINLYDFFPIETYMKLCDTINTKYNGNVSLWLDDCAKVRDAAIFGVTDTPSYKEFNDSKNLLKEYDIDMKIGEHSIYNETCDGGLFISIDLKKANFQALKFAGVLHNYSYEEFITEYGGDEYIINSKYLRQVIFGKMNPSRTIKVERYLTFRIHEIVTPCFKNWELISFNNDELIYKIPDIFSQNEEALNNLVSIIKSAIGIDVRIECVRINRLPIVNSNENKIDAFVRTNVNTGESVLKKASTTFYPQIYKLWKGLPIQEEDLYAYFEDQLIKFIRPLKLIKNNLNDY